MERNRSSRGAVLLLLYLLYSPVLGTAEGQYGAGTPVRRRLNSQNGASAPYHEAVKAANRAAKARAKGISDAEPESAPVHHLAIMDSSAQPLQAAAATTIVVYTPPTAGVLDGGAFSTFLQTNQANSQIAGVKLAPGNYSVQPYSNQGHIYLTCSATRTSAFKIDLSNTLLTFTVGTIGYIVLDTCTGVTLTGPTTLTYTQAQFPFAQATILTVTDALHYTIQIWSYFLPAWNNIIQTNSQAGTGVLYSGTTQEVYQPNRGGADFIVDFTQVTALSASVFNVVLVRNPYATVYAGDITALAQISDATGIALYGSSKCTVSNINMITAAGFGFYDGIPVGQNSYLNNNLAPSPVPGSDGNVQLMTSIHDGFHTTSAAVGPIINNCSFVGAGDDSVAIQGRMYTVAAFNAAANSIIAGSGIISPAELNTGDWIWVYDPTGRLLGSTYVVSVATVNAPSGVLSTTVDSVFQTTFSGYNYLQVIVTVWPPGFSALGLGAFITVPSRSGANFRVTSTYIYNGRGCGVIAKASNGTISGNSINKMLYPAIELSPNFEAKEGAFVSNSTVINNNINTLSQGILLGSNFALDLPYAYGNNINNTFTNNQVTGCQISPLTLESALTVNMANNAFTDVLCNSFGGNTRQFGWETQNTPFNLAFVYGIFFSGNTIGTTSACTQNFANYAVPTVFINVTHVVGQPLPINPNAPPIYSPPPGALPPPPPPPGGMVIPSVLPGAPPFNIFNKSAVHQEFQNIITQARVDLSLAKPDVLG